jgi:hypothetical protein
MGVFFYFYTKELHLDWPRGLSFLLHKRLTSEGNVSVHLVLNYKLIWPVLSRIALNTYFCPVPKFKTNYPVPLMDGLNLIFWYLLVPQREPSDNSFYFCSVNLNTYICLVLKCESLKSVSSSTKQRNKPFSSLTANCKYNYPQLGYNYVVLCSNNWLELPSNKV